MPLFARVLPALLTTALAFPQVQEMATHDLEAPANFRSKVNLVLVPVVVRDKKGASIGTLKKEDFQLFDKGKLQVIEKFSVEKAGSRKVEFEPQGVPDDPTAQAEAPIDVADRYTIYLFDDLHLAVSDLMQVRVAAERHFTAALSPTERVAIYTTSGRTKLELTDSRESIITTMRSIQANSRVAFARQGCPPMTHYMADLISNKNDPSALNAAVADTMACQAGTLQQATSQAQATARMTLSIGDADSQLALINMRNIVRRLAALPGERNIVLISPGFLVTERHSDVTELIDLAIRSRVTINSLDARGLHLIGVVMDASERTVSLESISARLGFDRQDATSGSLLLGELSDGTGGTLFQNNNDLTEGFKKLTTAAEYTYILGFSPQNLKLDGSLHALKVKLKDPSLNGQARRGYYAPKHLADQKEEARREIQEALFSREVMRDLPVELHTQYFKGTEFDAKLGVLAKVDLSQLHFKKEDGRNLNNLTVVAALFDRNGNYLQGASKLVEMKLKDETLQSKTRAVITIKTSFDVKIGGYVIRLVVRDSEGQLMAAQNGSVVIP